MPWGPCEMELVLRTVQYGVAGAVVRRAEVTEQPTGLHRTAPELSTGGSMAASSPEKLNVHRMRWPMYGLVQPTRSRSITVGDRRFVDPD